MIKRNFAILILSLFSFFAFMQLPTTASNENKKPIFSPNPSLKLSEALELAEAYISKNKIDISNHYLDNIRLHQQSPWMEGKHWILTWKIKKYVDGGEFFIVVGMDKTIKIVYGE